jgi:hypothetical protein
MDTHTRSWSTKRYPAGGVIHQGFGYRSDVVGAALVGLFKLRVSRFGGLFGPAVLSPQSILHRNQFKTSSAQAKKPANREPANVIAINHGDGPNILCEGFWAVDQDKVLELALIATISS